MKSWGTVLAVAALGLGACSGANVSDVATCQHDLGAAEAQATACKLSHESADARLAAVQEKLAAAEGELAAVKGALAKRGGEAEPPAAQPAAEPKRGPTAPAHAAAPGKAASAAAPVAVAAAPAPRGPRPANAPITLGFAYVGAESDWRTANTQSILDAAAAEGIQLKTIDAHQNQENQIKAIRSLIAQKVDAIVFTPVVASGWEQVLREAKAAGIPVLLSDRAVDCKDDSLWAAYLASDFVEEGRRAARWLLEEVKNRKGEVRVVELQGTAGSAPAIDRKRGFEEIIKGHPEIKIVHSVVATFQREKGKAAMEAYLKTGGPVDVVYAHNDDVALGAVEALEAAGKKPGKEVLVIGVDAVRAAFEAMAAGKMNVTVECSPMLGPQIMAAVKQLVAGKPIPKRIVTKEGVFTAEVAARELPNRKY